jgi:hypothetical protein
VCECAWQQRVPGYMYTIRFGGRLFDRAAGAIGAAGQSSKNMIRPLALAGIFFKGTSCIIAYIAERAHATAAMVAKVGVYLVL